MVLLLDNPVQDYAWGSPTVIPELLGVPPTGQPQAELWAGAHPSAPSRVEVGGVTSDLDALIRQDPEAMLGPDVRARFGNRLPYLLKILAIDQPLSIQAHPTIEQAETGFAAEEAAGVALDAPHRLYRDRSHKPEMIVALTKVEALIGFRDPTDAADTLEAFGIRALDDAAARLRVDGERALCVLVQHWLRMPDSVAAELAGLVTEAAHGVDGEPGRLVRWLGANYPGDRGIVLALLVRHELLKPGEAAFIPAGVPHAYLHGVAVEPQASSDNTLRAGLTAKHVDADALLEILGFETGQDPVVVPDRVDEHVAVFAPDVAEFVLYKVAVAGEQVRIAASGPRIVLATAGAVRVSATSGAAGAPLRAGRAAFAPNADGPLTLDGSGTAFVIATPPRA